MNTKIKQNNYHGWWEVIDKGSVVAHSASKATALQMAQDVDQLHNRKQQGVSDD